MSIDLIIHAQMRALVQKFGCYDAVAEALNARWGGGHSKSTVSRKMNGTLDWTHKDMIALQDALGEYPIWRTAKRYCADAVIAGSECVTSIAGIVAKEVGEAVNAALSAEQSARAGDIAEAQRETDEAMEYLARLMNCLQVAAEAAERGA